MAAALSALVEAGADNLDGFDRSLRFYRTSLSVSS
jgi:hypothetical protein